MKKNFSYFPRKLGKMNKSGVEFQFAWLFGLIVGMTVLVLVIYAVTRIVQTEELAIDAATAKEIGVLLNPLEIGFESAKTTTLILPKETRIFNGCDTEDEGYFGRQTIRISQRSFNKWTNTDIDVGFSNKYIFSENFTEGKRFLIFSKPFDFPFKVSDVIYLTSSDKKYCFEIDQSNEEQKEISEELGTLGQENIFIKNCPAGSTGVCFSGNCEIQVDLLSGYVEKDSKKMHFQDNSMMYAAIFSEPKIYECQIERLMKRGGSLASLYAEKADIVAEKGCNSDLKNELEILSNRLNDIKKSANINTALISDIENLREKNKIANCKLW